MLNRRFSLWQLFIALTVLAIGFGLGVLYSNNFFLTREVKDLQEENIVIKELSRLSPIAERLELRAKLVREILKNTPIDQKQLTEEAFALADDRNLYDATYEEGKSNVRDVIGHITPYIIAANKFNLDTYEIYQVLEAAGPFLLEDSSDDTEKQ